MIVAEGIENAHELLARGLVVPLAVGANNRDEFVDRRLGEPLGEQRRREIVASPMIPGGGLHAPPQLTRVAGGLPALLDEVDGGNRRRDFRIAGEVGRDSLDHRARAPEVARGEARADHSRERLWMTRILLQGAAEQFGCFGGLTRGERRLSEFHGLLDRRATAARQPLDKGSYLALRLRADKRIHRPTAD